MLTPEPTPQETAPGASLVAPERPAPQADEPVVRLDSLDPERGARSFRFRGFRRAAVAHDLDDVVPAIREVEGAVAAGLHAAGYLAYEAAPALDAHLATRPPRPDLPLLWFGLFDERVETAGGLSPPGELDLAELRPSISASEYRAAVRRILEWIAAGDSYQVNHTFRMRAAFRGSDEALYRRVCAAQRAAHCAYLRLPRFSILSASPELFFRRTGDAMELRPMKGTRPRGRWIDEDDALAAELVASEKERAENLMIVDLLRNDAGRVARFGSVRVTDLFRVERYPTIQQLTSTIRARTRPGTTLEDELRVLFPSGSVTGAPKIRTSEIIAELEDSPRGVYTGAIGCVSPGEAVFGVAIRTVLYDRDAGEIELGVGAGITAGSEPDAEWRECLAKAVFVHRSSPAFRLLEALRYETDGVGAGRGFDLLDAHLARMAGSARYFGFRFDAARVRRRLADHARELRDGVHKVRILLDLDGAVEVESRPIDARSRTGPLEHGRDLANATSGTAPCPPAVRVAVVGDPIDERDPFLYHKTTRRDAYRSRAASRPDCDDVLLLNRRGELTESTTANLVLRLDGELVTPPIDAGLLPGVLRGDLLSRGAIRTRPLTPADLDRAEAVYLISSVRRWRRAVVVR